jgi:hypothetical protein
MKMRTIYRSGSHSYVNRNKIVLHRVLVINKLQVSICRPQYWKDFSVHNRVKCDHSDRAVTDTLRSHFQSTVHISDIHACILYCYMQV